MGLCKYSIDALPSTVKNIFVSGYSTTVVHGISKKSTLPPPKNKFVFVSDYSATMRHGTLKKSVRLDTFQKK